MDAHELVSRLRVNQIVWDKNAKNADGTAARYRITSLKTWKKDRNRLYIGFKYGLYNCFQVHSVEQFDQFITTIEPERVKPQTRRKK